MVLSVPFALEICPTTTATRSVCGCTGGRPATAGRRLQEGTGLFHGRKQHHRLLEIVREVIAVVEALIALGPETAVGIDRGLRRAVDGEALLRRHGGAVVRHRGLGIVTVIPVVPMAAFTCSGLSSNPASSRSTRGRGIIDRVVVVDSALPFVLAHPATTTQMTAPASVASGWRMFSSPFQP